MPGARCGRHGSAVWTVGWVCDMRFDLKIVLTWDGFTGMDPVCVAAVLVTGPPGALSEELLLEVGLMKPHFLSSLPPGFRASVFLRIAAPPPRVPAPLAYLTAPSVHAAPWL